MEAESVSLWSKKQSDVTVGDTMKIALVTGTVMVLIPIVVGGAVAGVQAVASKLRKKTPIVEVVETEQKEEN